MIPNQLKRMPVSSATVSDSDTLPFREYKEDIKVQQEVHVP
jgi:hypothetical protein